MYAQLEIGPDVRLPGCLGRRPRQTLRPQDGGGPKLVASQIAFDVTRASLEMFGGSGVMRETGMEKLMRDGHDLPPLPTAPIPSCAKRSPPTSVPG